MLINIAPPGPPQMMEMSIFGKPSFELNGFLQKRQEDLNNRLVASYGDAGLNFVNDTNRFYNDYVNSTGVKTAEQMILLGNSIAVNTHSNYMTPLETLDELLSANRTYQNYLMANPTVRTLYLEDLIEGYSDTYINHDATNLGFEQNDFREVVNSLSRSSYDESFDGDEEWITTTHSEQLEEPLNFLEKVNVINAWRLQDSLVRDGKDPTSIDGFNIRAKTKED